MVDRLGGHVPQRAVMDWPAIIAGAAIAAGVTLVLTGLTAALGLGVISAKAGEGMGSGALIVVGSVTLLTIFIAYGLGGYIAGRMRTPSNDGAPEETSTRDGVHGLTVWAVGTLLGAVFSFMVASDGLKMVANTAAVVAEAGGSAVGGAIQGTGQIIGGVATGAGQVAGGVAGGVGNALGGAVEGAGQAASSDSLQDMLPDGMTSDPIDYLTDQLLRPETVAPSGFSNESIRREIRNIIGTVIRTGELPQADRDYLKQALAARTELSEADIDTRIDEAEKAVTDMRDQAQEMLDEAKKRAEELAQQARDEAQKLQDEARDMLAQAEQAAVDAAEAARKTAVWGALILAITTLLGAVIAFGAAVRGGRDRDTGRFWMDRGA